jgi:hypothetical protein
LQNLIYKSAFRFRDENEGPLQQDKSVSEFAKLHGDTKRPTIEELTSHEFVELAIQLVNSLFVLNRYITFRYFCIVGKDSRFC